MPGDGGRGSASPGESATTQLAQSLDLDVSDLAAYGPRIVQMPEARVQLQHRDSRGISHSTSHTDPETGFTSWKSGVRPYPFGLDKLTEASRTYLARSLVEALALSGAGLQAIWLPEGVDAGLLPAGPLVVLEAELSDDLIERWGYLEHRPDVRIAQVAPMRYGSATDARSFVRAVQRRTERARPMSRFLAARRATERASAAEQMGDLIDDPDLLTTFATDIGTVLAGDTDLAQLIYLALTTRLLTDPVSVVVKGASSSGKSFLVKQVLNFVPADAFVALTAMSDRALIYFTQPLSHRFLVMYEEGGATGNFVTYAVRSLLSEHEIRYHTVVPVEGGAPEGREMHIAGPTGLITTTTRVGIHPENETRMLSLTVADSPEQTRAILRAQAGQTHNLPDYNRWVALQNWLSLGDRAVSIPYLNALAELVPHGAVRTRRDFGKVQRLIEAHALLHQAHRETDEEGKVVATLRDYRRVRQLVNPVLRQATGALVTRQTRETVRAVEQLAPLHGATNVTSVARFLGVEPSTALRRVRSAVRDGYIESAQAGPGREHRLRVISRPQENKPFLPRTSELREKARRMSETNPSQ